MTAFVATFDTIAAMQRALLPLIATTLFLSSVDARAAGPNPAKPTSVDDEGSVPDADRDAPTHEVEGPTLVDDDAQVSAGADVEVEGEALGGTEAVGSGMKGRLGLMGTRTVSGLNGVSLRYYVADKLTLGLTTGAAIFTHREADDDGEFKQNNTVGLFGIGPSIFYWPYQGSRSSQVYADFGVGARALVYLGFTGANDDDAQDTLEDPLEIDIEIPVSTQLWVGRRVSIAPEFGVAFRIIPGSREPDDNGDFDTNPGSGVGSRLGTTDGPGFGFELGSTAGLFMGLHVGYWFGKL